MTVLIQRFLLLGFAVWINFPALSQAKKPNILFIAVDDLRAELGHLGDTQILTPNLDELAKEAVSFSNHFVAVPTCGASRAAFLTGRRPSRRVELNNNIMQDEFPKKEESSIPETFIHHLRRNGYHTVGIGKISHSADGYVYGYEEEVSDQRELPYSWDELLFDAGKWKTGWNAFFAYSDGENRQSMNKQVKPYEAGDVDDLGYPDGLTTQLAISKLKDLKNQNEPFFLGIGLFKPHLPFTAPKKYWDLYQEDQIEIAKNPNKPLHVSDQSLLPSGEFNQYALGEEHPNLSTVASKAYAQKIKHAYYAAASYSDAQIGLILDALKALDLEKNTIVIIWGDHGWHLGEQQIWGKHTLFENALNSALILKIPGKTEQGRTENSIVESVDIYPTIMELTGIDAPGELDGESLVSLILQNQNRQKKVAYGYFNNGITVRNDRYRLTRFYRNGGLIYELYDHQIDPLESVNIAKENPDIVLEMIPLLEKGNTGLFEK
ncbi:arylsulfatase A-like enzyme [Algoriphagus iocasae]|uniref:Arylsulfatase A-like enzyme n=1 Tax=Algoriphagus iocasae TaxID=1836499 RepID=A0A841MT06_9BACT|nr:sulfatase [Algoriphagus iocasae]MBB6325151.1 arylsulfatase A-like enzyme [Algoriphagus iocasae]